MGHSRNLALILARPKMLHALSTIRESTKVTCLSKSNQPPKMALHLTELQHVMIEDMSRSKRFKAGMADVARCSPRA